jgi:hypothetical protein
MRLLIQKQLKKEDIEIEIERPVNLTPVNLTPVNLTPVNLRPVNLIVEEEKEVTQNLIGIGDVIVVVKNQKNTKKNNL